MLKTIKSRLIAICIAIVIAAIGVATLASHLSVSAHVRRQVLAQLSDLGQAHAGTMGAWVRAQKDIVAALGSSADLDNPPAMLEQALKSGRLDLAYLGRPTSAWSAYQTASVRPTTTRQPAPGTSWPRAPRRRW